MVIVWRLIFELECRIDAFPDAVFTLGEVFLALGNPGPKEVPVRVGVFTISSLRCQFGCLGGPFVLIASVEMGNGSSGSFFRSVEASWSSFVRLENTMLPLLEFRRSTLPGKLLDINREVFAQLLLWLNCLLQSLKGCGD